LKVVDGKDISVRAFAKIIGFGDHIGDHATDGLPNGVKFLMFR
jgi:hypothetical protein